MLEKPPEPPTRQRHKTVPLAQSMVRVRGYPTKLVLFKSPASPCFWVRCYMDHKMIKRSTRTQSLREATEYAKTFYDELLLRQRRALPINDLPRFELCAQDMLSTFDKKVSRGERAASTLVNERYRMEADVMPYFRDLDVREITYDVIDRFLERLSDRGLSAATLKLHLSTVRKVLVHAHQRNYISHLPALPSIESDDNPRGHFTREEFQQLMRRVTTMAGQRHTVRYTGDTTTRTVVITSAVADLMDFMTSTFVRPTDIKVLRHKHVTVVRNQDNQYLRLSHPETKGHSAPMISMAAGVAVYARMLRGAADTGHDDPEDYLFLPEQGNRTYALTQLRRQFDCVLNACDLKLAPDGQKRTLYSLRHTAIIWRLLNSDGLDLLTLARNARTSPVMIDRFYARYLQAEQQVDLIQSDRHVRRARERLGDSDEQARVTADHKREPVTSKQKPLRARLGNVSGES